MNINYVATETSVIKITLPAVKVYIQCKYSDNLISHNKQMQQSHPYVFPVAVWNLNGWSIGLIAGAFGKGRNIASLYKGDSGKEDCVFPVLFGMLPAFHLF